MKREMAGAVARQGRTAAVYRAVWRWHALAGIAVVPLAVLLAITGAIYAWRPQYEAWRYRALLQVTPQAKTLTADEQFAAACKGQPWWATPVQFRPSLAAGRTSETIFSVEGHRLMSVFVNPHDGTVVGTRVDDDRFMERLRLLHGELLGGARGGWVIELAASAMALVLLTGLYLWWPRPRFAVWGFLLPRLRAKGRVFWRDLHAVPAVWCAIGALWQLGTGLPATRVTGVWWQKGVEAVAGRSPKPLETPPLRSELAGWTPPARPTQAPPLHGLAGASPILGLSGMSAAERRLPPGVTTPPPITLERVVAIARRCEVRGPYVIGLADGPTDVLRVLSDRSVTEGYTYLQLDQYSGRVLADVNYGNFGAWNRVQRWTEVAHAGGLGGWRMQVVATLACAGVLLMAASGAMLWWRRRPARVGLEVAPLPRVMVGGTLGLALVLPWLAASLGAIVVLEWARGVWSKRSGWRRWRREAWGGTGAAP